MAETTIPLSLADVTATSYDATSGTPLSYTYRLTEGTVSWTEHHPERVEALDNMGAVIGTRDGAKTGRSEVTLNCMVFDVGDNSTDVNLLDIFRQDGDVGTDWVSTLDGVTGERKSFNFKLAIANRTGSQSGTAIKGGMFVFPNADVVPGWTCTAERGGWRVQATLRSTAMAPTVTRTT